MKNLLGFLAMLVCSIGVGEGLQAQPLPLEYAPVQERDVFWERRVWREIDTRQKMNLFFKNPEKPFIQTILQAARCGEIRLFSPMDDEFNYALTLKEISDLVQTQDSVWVTDPETHLQTLQIVTNDLDPNRITGYRLKEVWYFDSQRSTFGVRILGLAPLVEGRPLCWLYYPENRKFMVAQSVPEGAPRTWSWDDVWEARYFASHIIKVSNVHDRRIEDYAKNELEALVEAQKLEQEMRNFEEDLWER